MYTLHVLLQFCNLLFFFIITIRKIDIGERKQSVISAAHEYSVAQTR